MKNVKSKSGNFGKAIGAIVLAAVFAEHALILKAQ